MPGYRVSQLGLFSRELGLRPKCVGSVLDPTRGEASTISGLVQSRCCLVKRILDPWDKERINEKMKQISDLVNNPGLDYRELPDELNKCCKAGWQFIQKSGTFVEKRTVIRGIQFRASNICQNDPTYEKRQRKELDMLLENNIRRLFYSIRCTENRF
jgi:hypothetical protein